VNFRSPSAPTVLMLAVDDGLTDIVNFLLEVGADPNIHDSVIMCCLVLSLFSDFQIPWPFAYPMAG